MKTAGFTLEKLAEITESELIGDPQHLILGVSDLESASISDASFLSNLRYQQKLKDSQAGVIIVSPDIERNRDKNFLVHKDPSTAFQKVLELFLKERSQLTAFTGIHSTAVIHPSAKIGSDVTIGPYAVIDGDVQIGDNTTISSHCYIGMGTRIGFHCYIHPHAVIRECCTLGNHVVIQPGAVIGSCGFGYTQDEKGHHHKLEQLGSVRIENRAEIGANTTIDRARFQETLVGEGSKIDNLVQIAHAVQIGKHVILAGQTGIAGSTKVGDHTMMGGQVAVNGHIEIGPMTMIAAKSGVSKSLKSGKYSGIPAYEASEYNRDQVNLRKIRKLVKRIEALENLKS